MSDATAAGLTEAEREALTWAIANEACIHTGGVDPTAVTGCRDCQLIADLSVLPAVERILADRLAVAQAEHSPGELCVEADERAEDNWHRAESAEREAAEARERLAKVEALADEMAATIVLLAHDAHPVYGSTTGWRGGIGGQAMTPGCSIIDPPPGVEWTQYDLPTQPARDWINEHPFDLDAIKAQLIERWTAALAASDPASEDER